MSKVSGGARAGFGAAELRDQLGMLARSLLHIARVEALQPLRLRDCGSNDHRARGKQGENVTHTSLHHRIGISRR
jgi:hypothetical protein